MISFFQMQTGIIAYPPFLQSYPPINFFPSYSKQIEEMLISLATCVVFIISLSYSQLTITIGLTNYSIGLSTTAGIQNITWADECGKMVARGNFLYHLSNKEILQSFANRGVLTSTGILDFSINNVDNISDFDVIANENQLALLNPTNINQQIIAYSLSWGMPTFDQYIPAYLTTKVTLIYLIDQLLYRYYQIPANGNDTIAILDLNTGTQTTSVLNHTNASLVLTPDRLKAVVWNYKSQIFIYTTTSFTMLRYYAGSIMGTYYSTNTISFSSDSSLAFIEADQFSTLKVYNLTSYLVYKQISVSYAIKNGIFLSNDVVLLFAQNSIAVWNLISNTINTQILYNIPYTVIINDHQNGNIFTCSKNIIFKYSVTVQAPTIINGTNTTNTTNNSGIANSSTAFEVIIMEYSVIDLTDTQAEAYDNLHKIIDASTYIFLQKAVVIAGSTPLAFYALSFLNFINLSCLYILLQITLPKQIYQCLEIFYRSINIGIIQIFGMNPNIQRLTDQRIKQGKYIQLGLSSDVLSSDTLLFATIFINVLIGQLLRAIGRKLSNNSIAKGLLIRSRQEIIYGQLIQSMIPFTLPWISLLNDGTNNNENKVNLLVQFLLLFGCLMFSFMYFLHLLAERRKNLCFSVSCSKVNHIKFGQLVTWKVIDEWHTAAGNFIYPFFVVFPSPLPFLIIITLYLIIGSLCAWNKQESRIKNIILSLYYLVFHSCFIVLYASDDDYTQANAGILILCTLLVGSFHHSLALIYGFFRFVYRMLYKKYKSSQIKPEEEDNHCRKTCSNQQFESHFICSHKLNFINTKAYKIEYQPGTAGSKSKKSAKSIKKMAIKSQKMKIIYVTSDNKGNDKKLTPSKSKKEQVSALSIKKTTKSIIWKVVD